MVFENYSVGSSVRRWEPSDIEHDMIASVSMCRMKLLNSIKLIFIFETVERDNK